MPLRSDQDTYVTRKGVSPNTVSEISSKTKIYAVPAMNSSDAEAQKVQIGVIAQFDPSESRSLEPIRGIGHGDQIAEIIPGYTEPVNLSITRTAQYLSSIFQVLGYKGGIDGLVRSLKHHRWPFDVHKESVFSELVSDSIEESAPGIQEATEGFDFKALITIYEACWFQDWNSSYSSDTSLVQENGSMMASDVYDGTEQIITDPRIDTGNRMQSSRFSDDSMNL